MKNIIKVTFVILLTAQFAFGQSSDTPVMQFFSGGKMDFKLNIGMNSFGAGNGSGNFGGVISPSVRNGSASIFSNPAELGLLKTTEFFFDTKMGFSPTALGATKDDIIAPDMMAESLDEILLDTTTFIFKKGSFRKDIEVNSVDLGLAGGMTAFGIAMPINNKLTAAIGYSIVADMSFGLFISGIATSLKTTKAVGSNDTEIDIILDADVLTDISLKINQLSFALGGEVMNNRYGNLNAGISFNRYSAAENFFLDLNTNGMMVLNNSLEYYFNDPNDQNLNYGIGEQNDLYWKATGNFKATEWGIKFGTYYHYTDKKSFLSNFKFSLIYDYMPQLALSDKNASNESYQPNFLVGRFMGEDDDALGFVVDSINLAKPHLTKATNNPFSDKAIITFPSSLTFGVDANFRGHTFALNLIKYMDELSYEFAKYKVGLKANIGFKAGMDFLFPDKLEGWNWALLPVRLLFLDIDGLVMQAFQSRTGYKSPH
ncbi:MAG: hypothetical protein ABIG69_07725, partial [Bacteroidota bacterium]